MYRVIVSFDDLKDGRHRYNAGDAFPRDGYSPSPKRIAELSGTNNKRGVRLIEKVEEFPLPKPEPVLPQAEEPEPEPKRRRTRKK